MTELYPEQRAALAYLEQRGSQASVESIAERLRSTLDQVEQIVGDISPMKALAKPPGGGWSVLEVVDHLVASHEPATEELRQLIAGDSVTGEPIAASLQSAQPGVVQWSAHLENFRRVHGEFLSLVESARDCDSQATAPIAMDIKCKNPEDGELKTVEWTERLDWKAYAIGVRMHVHEHLPQIRRTLAAVES